MKGSIHIRGRGTSFFLPFYALCSCVTLARHSIVSSGSSQSSSADGWMDGFGTAPGSFVTIFLKKMKSTMSLGLPLLYLDIRA